MHFIFSNEEFLKKLEKMMSLSQAECSALFNKLGVHKAQNNIVTVIAISKDCFSGFDILFTLTEECEIAYQKSIDVNRLRVVVFKDLISASKSPHLERASFILFVDENLLSAKDYPELKTVLPFL